MWSSSEENVTKFGHRMKKADISIVVNVYVGDCTSGDVEFPRRCEGCVGS